MRHVFSIVYTILMLVSTYGLAQLHPTYKLDIYSGLPSNYVFMTLKDKLGYLWIATDKGLARYNGYTIKIFSSSTGLPYNEVYGMILDKQDRLWLYGFSSSIGYIKQNKYHNIPLNNKGILVNPHNIQDLNGGVSFTTYLKNDSAVLLQEKKGRITKVFTSSGAIVHTKDYILTINGAADTLNIFKYNGQKITEHKVISTNKETRKIIGIYSALTTYHNYVIAYQKNNYVPIIINTETGMSQALPCPGHPNEYGSYVYAIGKYLYVLYQSHLLKLDSTLQNISVISLTEFAQAYNISARSITHILDDDFWKNGISTERNGIYFSDSHKSMFVKEKADLKDYIFIGYRNNASGYWWNAYTRTLAQVNEQGNIAYKKIDVKKNVERVVPYNSEKSLLMADKLYWIYHSDMTLSNILYNPQTKTDKSTDVYRSLDASFKIDSSIYIVTSRGLYYHNFSQDSVRISRITTDRFRNIVFDSLRQLYYVHHNEKIVAYYPSGQQVNLSKEFLSSCRLNSIEQILVDNKYGNIFIKDRDQLVCVHPETRKYTKLHVHFNLTDAKLFLQNNILITVGRFGIIFNQITGINSISNHLIFPNYKDWHYTFVYSVQVFNKKILIKTDKGFYSVAQPEYNDFNSVGYTAPVYYKLISLYNNKVVEMKGNDTLFINGNNRKIRFDIINPEGNGVVEYSCLLQGVDTAWKILNADEVDLQALRAGHYYTLLLKAADNVWRSKTHYVRLYIKPKWWETSIGIRVSIVVGIFFILLIGYIIVLITKRRAAKNNAKRNRLLELEIKSIYSQLNPHFIFNTLNGALQFIRRGKMDEAYAHILKFSKLLRSYLKSSRNRLITIDNEIENLKNYIELQQTRFDHRFTYEIMNTIPISGSISIPSLLLQPIVENAINHGLLPKDGKGHLQISFKLSIEGIICIIDDDGVGFLSKEHYNKSAAKTESYGNQLVDELISLHNEYESMGISIKYKNKAEPEHGTIVYIVINNPHYNETL